MSILFRFDEFSSDYSILCTDENPSNQNKSIDAISLSDSSTSQNELELAQVSSYSYPSSSCSSSPDNLFRNYMNHSDTSHRISSCAPFCWSRLSGESKLNSRISCLLHDRSDAISNGNLLKKLRQKGTFGSAGEATLEWMRSRPKVFITCRIQPILCM